MENLILVHGALGTSKSWEHIFPHLEKHYHIYNITLPGHGTSSEKIQEYSLPFFADSIHNYCQAQGLQEYVLAGYSMGGYIGLYMAANHYQGMKKLYTIATKVIWDEAIANKEAGKLDYNMLAEKAPQFLSMQQNLHPNHWPNILSDTQQILKHIGQNALDETHLQKIQIPVYMCVGSADTLVTQEETIRASKQIVHGNSSILENQPHILEKMDGGVVGESIKGFV